MIIYCNYTTICRKVQACTFFLWWKKNFQRYHSRYKIPFSWISNFFRKERTVFHLSISTTEHHFHVETLTFLKKETWYTTKLRYIRLFRTLSEYTSSICGGDAYSGKITYLQPFKKVRKRNEKSRRYVITRIYGFFVFSEICTFVQCRVRRNNIRRIFCRCVLKFTCEKIVRQCDRKTLLYYGFPVDSCYSGKFLLFSVLFWQCPKLEILSFPKKLCDNATAVLLCKIF